MPAADVAAGGVGGGSGCAGGGGSLRPQAGVVSARRRSAVRAQEHLIERATFTRNERL